MDPWEKKKWLAVVALVLLCVTGSWWQSRENVLEKSVVQATEAGVPEKREKIAKITVYISGAVQEPGLYQVKPGIRYQEALEEAGGATKRSRSHPGESGQKMQRRQSGECSVPEDQHPEKEYRQSFGRPTRTGTGCKGRGRRNCPKWQRDGKRQSPDQFKPGGGRRTDPASGNRAGSGQENRGIPPAGSLSQGRRPAAGIRHRSIKVPAAETVGGGVKWIRYWQEAWPMHWASVRGWNIFCRSRSGLVLWDWELS